MIISLAPAHTTYQRGTTGPQHKQSSRTQNTNKKTSHNYLPTRQRGDDGYIIRIFHCPQLGKVAQNALGSLQTFCEASLKMNAKCHPSLRPTIEAIIVCTVVCSPVKAVCPFVFNSWLSLNNWWLWNFLSASVIFWPDGDRQQVIWCWIWGGTQLDNGGSCKPRNATRGGSQHAQASNSNRARVNYCEDFTVPGEGPYYATEHDKKSWNWDNDKDHEVVWFGS